MRTDLQWQEDLVAEGPRNREAYQELSGILKGALRQALAARNDVDEATIEDFTQEALVKVLQALHRFRGDSKFTTWAISIAIRTAYTELRRARWRDVRLDALDIELPVEDAEKVDDDLDRRAVIEAMHRIIAEKLSPRQRRALMAELSGIPQVVIADQFGTTRNALYKLMHDARKRVKQGLLEAGFSESHIRDTFDL